MNDDARHQPPKVEMDRPASALTFGKDTKASQEGERAGVAPRNCRPSATQPNPGEGFSTLRPILSNEVGVAMEGVLAMREDEDEKEGSSAEGKEGSLEPEWTYPDGGLRAWLVVFVSTLRFRNPPSNDCLHPFGLRRLKGCWCFAASQLSTGMVWGLLVQYLHEHVYPDTSLAVLNVVGGLGNFVSRTPTSVPGRASLIWGCTSFPHPLGIKCGSSSSWATR
jgi:hypothetical protein